MRGEIAVGNISCGTGAGIVNRRRGGAQKRVSNISPNNARRSVEITNRHFQPFLFGFA
jgi:hypothetical protein